MFEPLRSAELRCQSQLYRRSWAQPNGLQQEGLAIGPERVGVTWELGEPKLLEPVAGYGERPVVDLPAGLMMLGSDVILLRLRGNFFSPERSTIETSPEESMTHNHPPQGTHATKGLPQERCNSIL